jgi:hypothetical protein
MLSNGIFSFRHSRFSIRPKEEAAAVWIIPFPLRNLKCYIWPRVVNGLMIPDAAELTGTSF